MGIAKRARVGTGLTAAQRGPTHAAARLGEDGTVLAKVPGTVHGTAHAMVYGMAHGMARVTLGAATRPAWATPLFARSVMRWKTRNMP